MLKSIKKAAFLGSIVGCILVLFGCHGYSATGGPGKTVNPSLISSPVQSRDLLRVNSIFIAPIEFDPAGRDAEKNRLEFYKTVVETATSESGLEVVGSDSVLSLYKSRTAGTVRDPADALAKKSGATGIFKTSIHDFQERVGSQVGANKPARIDFSLSLIDPSNNKTVWQANYHFEDTALSDNLFKIKDRFNAESGPGWKSAKEMFTKGVEEGCRKLYEERTAQFIR